jgi:hypothetical protein
VCLEVDARSGDIDHVRRHEQVDVTVFECPRELTHAVVAEVLGVGDDHGVDGIDVERLSEIGLGAQHRHGQVVGVEALVRRRNAIRHPHADHAETGHGVLGEPQGHRLGAANTADDEHLGQVVALAALAEHPRAPGPALHEQQRGADREGDGEESP